jgi:lipid II:glycine glycyltransferase (peptidoglycan interpeptide bridge formation enzyme)
VFCKVKSWFAGSRLVSLPFSDHAEPLVSGQSNLTHLLAYLQEGTSEGKWASVELRPPCALNPSIAWGNFRNGQKFALHSLDLQPSLDSLFGGLSKDSTRRKIRRAEREGLRYEDGQSEAQLQKFFRLSVITRRRKSLPPPPLAWFHNVSECLGERARIQLATTRTGELAGAIFLLTYKDTTLFKYGASDARFHKLGTMPSLLWKAIEEAKHAGATRFDFGRSEVENVGLVRFKDHFGATRSVLTHKVYPAMSMAAGASSWQMKVAKAVFSKLPENALILAGKLLYPHIG